MNYRFLPESGCSSDVNFNDMKDRNRPQADHREGIFWLGLAIHL